MPLPVVVFRRMAWIRSLALVALAFLLSCNHIADYDLWYHLRTGERLTSEGVPQVDDYSFMSAGRPYVDVHWLFQWGVAAIYRVAGATGLVITKAVIASGVVGVALLTFRFTAGSSVTFWSLWLALLLMSCRFYERPEIVTLLFTSIYLAILIHASTMPRLLFILPVVQVLWANIQGLYIFGPILFGMFTFDQLASRVPFFAAPDGKVARSLAPIKLLLLVGTLIAGACFTSPYGIANVFYVIDIWRKMDPATGDFYRGFIAELQPLREFLAEGGWSLGFTPMIFLVMAMGTLGVVVRWRAIVQGELFRALPVIAFTYLAWQAVRNVSHFALVVGIMSAWNLDSWLRERRVVHEWKIPTRRLLFMELLLPVGVCMLVGVMFVQGTWQRWMGSNRPFGFGLLPGQYSFEAMDLCRREGMPGRALVLHLGHAATYLYACGPERKVFADARLEVHSEEVIRQYRELGMAIERGHEADQRLPERFGVNVIVASVEHHVGVQASLLCNPYWQCVFWDPVAAVYVPSTLTLPSDVKRVDFREMIEQKAPEHDAPLHRLRVDSLSRLAQTLASRTNAPPGLVDQVTWAAYFASDDSPDERSSVLAAFWSLREAHRLGEGTEPIAADNLLDNWLVENTTRAMTEVTDNVTLPLFYQEYLAEQGRLEESLAILQRLETMPVRNAAQRKLKTPLREMIDRRRQTIQRRETSNVIPTKPENEDEPTEAETSLNDAVRSLLHRDLNGARSLTSHLSEAGLSPRERDWFRRLNAVLSIPIDQGR